MYASVKYALFSALFLSAFNAINAKKFLCSILLDPREQFSSSSICPTIMVGGHYDGGNLAAAFMKKFQARMVSSCTELSDIFGDYHPILMFKNPTTKDELIKVNPSDSLLGQIESHCNENGRLQNNVDDLAYAIYAFEKPNKVKDGIMMKVSVKDFPELENKKYYVTLNRDDTIESILDKMKVIWQNRILFDGWAKLVFRFEWSTKSTTPPKKFYSNRNYTTDNAKKLVYDDIQLALIGRDSVTLEIHGATALKKEGGNVKWAKLN